MCTRRFVMSLYYANSRQFKFVSNSKLTRICNNLTRICNLTPDDYYMHEISKFFKWFQNSLSVNVCCGDATVKHCFLSHERANKMLSVKKTKMLSENESDYSYCDKYMHATTELFACRLIGFGTWNHRDRKYEYWKCII